MSSSPWSISCISFYLGLNVDFVKESPTFAKLLPLVRIKLSKPNKIDSEQKLDKINLQ